MVEAEPDHPPDGDHTYCCKRDHLRSEEQVPEKVASFLPPRGATSRRGWSRLGAHADNTGSIAEHTFGSASSRSESGVYTNSSSEESRALATLAPVGATGKIWPRSVIDSTIGSRSSAVRRPEDSASTSGFNKLSRAGGKNCEIRLAFSRFVR